jgi:outer membrane protein insertion porin family
MKGISFIFLLLCSSLGFSQVISTVQFEGNKKSKEVFLRQNITLQEGEVFDSLKVQESAQMLRNTNLFFNVDVKVDSLKDGNFGILFQLEEVITIFPIIANGGSSERLNFTLGVSDIHFRGRGETIGFVYQYYDRHSFKFYQITPRHKNNKTGHEIFMGKYSTIEPLYFANGSSSPFNFDNYHLSLGGFFWFNRFLVYKLGGMLMKENYKNVGNDVNSSDYSIASGKSFNLFKYQVRMQLELRKIEHHYEKRAGQYNLFHIEWIETPIYSGASFLKMTNHFKQFLKFGERHNFIIRNETGIASNNESPFSPFVIDDFVNVRGIGNRVARGTAMTSFNSEYLFTFIKHPWFFAQMGVFFDLSYLRPAGEKIEAIFNASNTFTTAGLGLRLHSRKYYNTVFRLDYGINLKDQKQGGFVIGLGQYI